MAAHEPPDLCSACGRDCPVATRVCGCLGAFEAWTGGERTGLLGRRFRTAGGAEATIAFGRVQTARGQGRVSFPQIVPVHYGALRGDLVYALRDRSSLSLRDPPVDALLAALLGGAARGTIHLRGVRSIAWQRRGTRRRIESRHAGFDDISVERTGTGDPEEDRVLSALLDPPLSPSRPSASGYRGERAPVAWHQAEERATAGPIGLVPLLSAAIASDDLPESWLAAHASEEVPAPVAERTSRLLVEAWGDERHRELIQELTRHLRFALRSALARRGESP